MSNNSGLQSHLCEKVVEEYSITSSQIKYAELMLTCSDLRLEKQRLLNLLYAQRDEIKRLNKYIRKLKRNKSPKLTKPGQ